MHQLARIARMEIDIQTALSQEGLLDNYVFVQNGLTDLPTPGGSNNIQLLANTVYQFNGTNNIGVNHLVMAAGTIVIGMASQHDRIVSTTTGALIRASGGNRIICKDVNLSAVNGAMFDGNGCPSVVINAVTGSATKYGRFEDCGFISLIESSCNGIADANSGVELVNSSTGTRFAMVLSALIQDSGGTGALIDFGTSTWTSIAVETTELVSAVGGIDVTGLAANGNLVPDLGRGRFQSCVINGDGTHLVGITLDDILWAFNSNTGLADSVAIGAVDMSGNAVATTIGAANTPTKVAGTTTLSVAKRYDDDDGGSPADNHLRSVAKENNSILLTVELTITKSGATKLFNAQMFKNDTAIGDSIPISVTSGDTLRRFNLVDSVSENDEFELRIENTVDTDDATVIDMDFIVSTVS